jgi:predicted secreted protein
MLIVKTGQERIVSLQGNPSTGYMWRLSPAASEHLDILSVDDLGYAPREPSPDEKGPPIVGAPQEQRFRITGKTPGTAKLAFEYVRPWEGEAVERKDIRVEVRGP